MTKIPDRRGRSGDPNNVPVADLLPEGYAELLARVKNDVLATRLRAMRTANIELIALYWRIGKLILDRQREQGWGTSVIDRLAVDLRRDLVEQRGWSRSNLFSMRALAAAWPDPAIVQQAVGRLPWGQITVLLKLDDPADRDWYADQAALGGWSRKVLEHHIASGLRARAGAAENNFPTHLDSQDADQSPGDAAGPVRVRLPWPGPARLGA